MSATAAHAEDNIDPAYKPLRIALLGYRSNPFSGGQGIYLTHIRARNKNPPLFSLLHVSQELSNFAHVQLFLILSVATAPITRAPVCSFGFGRGIVDGPTMIKTVLRRVDAIITAF